jgi:NAD(P)-dependent dehydrogenase (short-subunit alcohol dehydrogenase family)
MALTNRKILVTGAAKRIGRQIAIRLYQEGAKVLLHCFHSEVEAKETASLCGGAPVYQADLTSVPAILSMFQTIQAEHGPLYGLVNNAARFTRIDPLTLTEADWDDVHDVNLKATFFCCQQAALQMKRAGGGRIVNISSLGGLRPWAEHAHYCASKAGVIMLTKALAKAFAPEITVNSVAPGVIPFGEPDARVQRLIQATPAKRPGTADEIADAVIFFLTATNFLTGQILAVDGGLSQK